MLFYQPKLLKLLNTHNLALLLLALLLLALLLPALLLLVLLLDLLLLPEVPLDNEAHERFLVLTTSVAVYDYVVLNASIDDLTSGPLGLNVGVKDHHDVQSLSSTAEHNRLVDDKIAQLPIESST